MSSFNTTTVSDIMQRDVLCAEDSWPLNRLARFLTDNQISGAPVTSKDGDLIGVVSLTDIVRHNSQPEGRASEQGAHEYYLQTLSFQLAQEEAGNYSLEHESSTTVRDIMTPMIFEVDEDASIHEAADTMIKGHIHRLFVTNKNRISGIVTAHDMLKVIRDTFEDRDFAARA